MLNGLPAHYVGLQLYRIDYRIQTFWVCRDNRLKKCVAMIFQVPLEPVFERFGQSDIAFLPSGKVGGHELLSLAMNHAL